MLFPFKKFNLLYHFLVASLLTIIVISFVITYLLIHQAETKMLEEKKEITASIVQQFNLDFTETILEPLYASNEVPNIHSNEFRAVLNEFVSKYMSGYNVRQINLIQADRYIVYSTNDQLEGIVGNDSEAFQKALHGGYGSKLMYHPEDGAKTSLEVFVPFYLNGEVVGVTMFYQDITDVILLINELKSKILLIMISGMFILFIILFLIVYRGHKIIHKQEKELIQFNQELEHKVTERTLELSEKNKKLQDLAIRDQLTGLFNHSEVKRQFRDLFVLQENQFSCLMIDIDHFKQINDNYGHQFGDQVIKYVATVISKSIRETDILGRYGGEEFIAILPEANEETSKLIAERVRVSICKHQFMANGKKLNVTVSIGLSSQNGSYQAIDEMIEEADQALYCAKNNGRNRVSSL